MSAQYNLVGQRFGRYLVLEYAEKGSRGETRYWCVCDCGTRKTVNGSNLVSNSVKSCGCLRKDRAVALGHEFGGYKPSHNPRLLKHGHSGGKSKKRSPTYGSFVAMKRRCLNPNDVHKYLTYGGAGVTICDRWLGTEGFTNFLQDLGPRPLGTTLGRFGDVGNYTPLNCKWMTSAEQVANWRPDRKFKRKKNALQKAA